MSELKTYMIDKILNEFLADFECRAELGSDFCYWDDCNLINYSLVMPQVGKDYFMENWHILAPEMTIDPFLASLLHEVAHSQTLHLLTEEEEQYCQKMKTILSSELVKREMLHQENRECYFTYFALPDEKLATDWAINYIRNHTQQISAFWQKLQTAIMEFYKINNVEV